MLLTGRKHFTQHDSPSRSPDIFMPYIHCLYRSWFFHSASTPRLDSILVFFLPPSLSFSRTLFFYGLFSRIRHSRYFRHGALTHTQRSRGEYDLQSDLMTEIYLHTEFQNLCSWRKKSLNFEGNVLPGNIEKNLRKSSRMSLPLRVRLNS